MKKIYLVPHSHWDREWYFSKDTSDVLFSHVMFDILDNAKKQKQLLDGQWSLVDDFIKVAPLEKENISALLKNGNINLGAFYSQPDVFNSLPETIIRNIEMGNKIAKAFNHKNSTVAYLPDTFGFGQNLSNIFDHMGIKNFVFWRGYPSRELNKSVIFKWNSKINAICLKDGYYVLGGYYPYNGKDSFDGHKWNPQKFADKLLKMIESYPGFKDEFIFPLGGDQAPFLRDQNIFLDEVRKILIKSNVDLEVASHYDDFFANNNKNFTHKYNGPLVEPFTGKIHKTIGGSRYDIKKLFRDAETKLYYQLEPLQIFYKTIDSQYHFDEYKDERILKPLFIAQTHDSLGACNTDSTNAFQLSRLNQIHENIDSEIDWICKRILQNNNLVNEEVLIFNPSPEKSTIAKRMTWYSDVYKNVNIESNDFKVFTLNSTNISLSESSIYKLDVVVYAKNLAPLSPTIFKLEEYPVLNKVTKISKNKDLKIKDVLKTSFEFSAVKDMGDSYDFSPGDSFSTSYTEKMLNSIVLNGFEFYEFEINLKILSKSQKVIMSIFKTNDITDISIDIDNNLKDVKISLSLERQAQKVYFTQNGGVILAENNEAIKDENWKGVLHEYPVNNNLTDGLIQNGSVFVATYGNNEFFVNEKSIELTLFRTYSQVTKSGMKWRPSTSGLSWKEQSPDSQLQKKLHFDFSIINNTKFSEAAKIANWRPYVYKNQKRNFTANKMSKFVINDILKFKKQKTIPKIAIDSNLTLLSINSIKNDILIRVSNQAPEDLRDAEIRVNEKTTKISLKANEIKQVEFKGVYNE